MNASIYTSLFNYSPDKFDLVGAFNNWLKYGNEIVIGTFPDQGEDIWNSLRDHWSNDWIYKNIKIAYASTSLDDPLFDGKLKNAALQHCSNEFVIQQDMDERIGGDPRAWEMSIKYLKAQNSTLAMMIPVIDLYKDYDHYKSLGYKWYLSPKKGCNRGPVNFAKKEGGLIDTEKSDTCELIDENGNLIPSIKHNGFLANNDYFKFDIFYPHVVHLGYLDLEKKERK